MKILHDVFDEQAFKNLDNSNREIVHTTLGKFSTPRLPDIINGTHRNIAHGAIADIEIDEQIVGYAVSRIHRVQIHTAQGAQGNRGIAALRIGDMPVTAGDFGEQGQDRVAKNRARGMTRQSA